MTLTSKTQDQAIKQLQKDTSTKVSESQLSEVLALINSGIQSDPNVTKLLKTKENQD